MLTGRWDKIDTIRTYKGLNGFLLRTESEHDCYGAGHAGTALSAALGTAVARDMNGEDSHVVAVAGDRGDELLLQALPLLLEETQPNATNANGEEPQHRRNPPSFE